MSNPDVKHYFCEAVLSKNKIDIHIGLVNGGIGSITFMIRESKGLWRKLVI